jgi:hypothetical protein
MLLNTTPAYYTYQLSLQLSPTPQFSKLSSGSTGNGIIPPPPEPPNHNIVTTGGEGDDERPKKKASSKNSRSAHYANRACQYTGVTLLGIGSYFLGDYIDASLLEDIGKGLGGIGFIGTAYFANKLKNPKK